MTQVILTDGKGRPLPRPEAPEPGATTAERIAWLRAVHAYNDRVTEIGNAAFNEAFRLSVRA